MDLPDAALSQPCFDDAQASADEAWLRDLLVDEIKDLTRLAKLGMEMSEAVTARAKAELSGEALSQPDDEAGPVVAARVYDLALGRASRTVRLTYARRALSIENLRGFNDDRKAAARTAVAGQRRAATLRRIVEGLALEGDADDTDGVEGEAPDREAGEREAVEREVAETCERLSDEDDDFGDLRGRPLSDDIAKACRLLGLSPDWSRLAKTAWARREMASGNVGEPLAALGAEEDARPKTLVRVQIVEPPPGRPGSWPPEIARPGPPFPEPPPETHSASPPQPPPDLASVSVVWPPDRPTPPTAVWLPGEGPPPRRRRF